MKKETIFLVLAMCAIFLVSCGSVPSVSTGSQPVSTATIEPTATFTAMPCTLLHTSAMAQTTGDEFGDRAHETGPVEAPVTMVFLSDYQCPACALLANSLKQIREAHPTDVRVIFINTPLIERDKDALVFRAAEAADLQGKFWEMNDLLFENQAVWSALAPEEFEDWVTQQASVLGLDEEQFRSDFAGEVVAGLLQQAISTRDSQSAQLPVLFVNSDLPYTGLADFASLDSVVRLAALTARQFSACPAWQIDPLKQYLVTLHTVRGDVVIQLYPEEAPLAVNNFVFLARQGWYEDITFYRVLASLRAESGDPSETGMGNPGYLFPTEISTRLSFDQPGRLAMDNSGPDTNGSRFFITLAAAPQLDSQYTIFGQVLSGMEALSTLTTRDPLPGISIAPGDELMGVTVEER